MKKRIAEFKDAKGQFIKRYDKLSTKGFTNGYNSAKSQFEQERIARIQRLNGLNRDRGGFSL